MKTPVANCSVMDATATSLIALISNKLYNLPPTLKWKFKNSTLPDCQLPQWWVCTRHKIQNIVVGNRVESCLNLSQSFKVQN